MREGEGGWEGVQKHEKRECGKESVRKKDVRRGRVGKEGRRQLQKTHCEKCYGGRKKEGRTVGRE